MSKFVSLASLLLMAFASYARAQGPGPSVTGAQSNGVTCTLPAFTYSWSVYNSGTLCGAGPGSACSNGNGIFSIPEAISSVNTLTQSTTVTQPIYTTGAINSLPVAAFNGAINAYNLAMTTPLPSTGIATFYAIVKPNATGTIQQPIFGNTNPNNALHGLSLQVVTATSQLILESTFAGTIATKTTPLSTSAYTAVAASFDYSTNNYVFWTCSGGTCTVDNSGTGTAFTFTTSTNAIGTSISEVQFFNGPIAEADVLLGSSSITGYAAYVNCKYGL